MALVEPPSGPPAGVPPETVLQEANRRRVFRVAGTYVATGYAVLEAAATLLPGTSLPEWAFRFVLGMLLLGFPLSMVLAWDYDITPHGIERTSEDPPPEPLSEPPAWRWMAAVLVALAVGLVLRTIR